MRVGAPVGPLSSIDKSAEHPVVHIAYAGCRGLCLLAGLAPPTEAEWETGGARRYRRCRLRLGATNRNSPARVGHYWHGDFPWRPEPGYGRTTSVGSFRPTDTDCSTWRATSGSGPATGTPIPAPGTRAARQGSYDPGQPQFVPRKVIKGGSFLCADTYCLRYRPAARRPQMVDTGMSPSGFAASSGKRTAAGVVKYVETTIRRRQSASL